MAGGKHHCRLAPRERPGTFLPSRLPASTRLTAGPAVNRTISDEFAAREAADLVGCLCCMSLQSVVLCTQSVLIRGVRCTILYCRVGEKTFP